MNELPKGDRGDREPTRRCPNRRCNRVILRQDEKAGRCPLCHTYLLSLAFEVAFCRKGETDETE